MCAPPTPVETRTTQARNLAGFGFIARDWHKIEAHAGAVTAGRPRAPVDDLQARFVVQAIVGDQSHSPGAVVIGTFCGRLVLAWPR